MVDRKDDDDEIGFSFRASRNAKEFLSAGGLNIEAVQPDSQTA